MKSLYKTSSNYRRLLIVVLPVSTLMKGMLSYDRLIFRINQLYAPLHQLTIYNKRSATHLQALSAKGRNGFTLVELIVTVTVLAIIVAIATPSILTQLTRMEAKRVKTQLENALALAKAESYITRQDVLVCLSNDGIQCDRNSDNMLILFVDKNGNKNFDTNADTLGCVDIYRIIDNHSVMTRLTLSDAQWAKIAPYCAGKETDVGRTAVN
ncbi:pilus assembly FimT family protein, partial [Psychrobacter pocilloporae]